MKILKMKKGTRSGIYSLIIGMFFINSGLFSQVKWDFRSGVPFGVSKTYNKYLKESYEIKNSFSLAWNIGFHFQMRDSSMYISSDNQFNDYFYSNDTIALRLMQGFLTIGLGKEFYLSKKIKIGCTLNPGVSLALQNWFKTTEKISYFESLNSKNQTFQSNPQIKIYLGADFYLGYKIGKSISLVGGFKNSFYPLSRLDVQDNLPIYGFYFCPYIGIRDILIPKKKR